MVFKQQSYKNIIEFYKDDDNDDEYQEDFFEHTGQAYPIPDGASLKNP